LTIAGTILTILVFVSLSTFFVLQQKGWIYADLRKRGMSIAKTLAYKSTYGVMIGDEGTLLKLIPEVTTNEDVAYVIFQDLKGNVLARTDTGLEPAAITNAVNFKAIDAAEASVQTWKPKKGSRMYDVCLPVISSSVNSTEPAGLDIFSEGGDGGFTSAATTAKGKVGVVRVGMSLATAEGAISKSILITTLFTVCFVIVYMFLTSKIMNTILNPLKQLLVCVRSIGEGDLTVRITGLETNDEVGQLASAFKQTQDNLTNIVKQIKSSAELVGTSVSELSSSSRQQAAGANQQSSALTETSSTIEELAIVSKQIADNAKKVAELSVQNLDGMETIKSNTTEGADRIHTMGEKSQSIGEVVELIDDITKQTNLLALNASIEAARAGEAGRGFSVVATEIRKLATNVAGSTDQIREIIKEIQNATNASVLATENVSKSVENGIEISKVAASSASQINMATQQQKQASDQMVVTVQEMVSIAHQTALGSDQIAETATKLAETTSEQKHLVEQFKLS
jgi:methyl-accepting chemotaxis protein